MAKTALDRIKQIKSLREEGYTLVQIGEIVGVAPSTVHVHSDTPAGLKKRSNGKCNNPHNGLSCCRDIGHHGVHLSDQTGKLIHWE